LPSFRLRLTAFLLRTEQEQIRSATVLFALAYEKGSTDYDAEHPVLFSPFALCLRRCCHTSDRSCFPLRGRPALAAGCSADFEGVFNGTAVSDVLKENEKGDFLPDELLRLGTQFNGCVDYYVAFIAFALRAACANEINRCRCRILSSRPGVLCLRGEAC
jgi:hypothetical protein